MKEEKKMEEVRETSMETSPRDRELGNGDSTSRRRQKKRSMVRDIMIALAILLIVGVGFAALSWKKNARDNEGAIREKVLTFVQKTWYSREPKCLLPNLPLKKEVSIKLYLK
ncbi:MAG: hypothetical protein IPL87_03235 [Candidatus Moraniibacteriota bacterium]|nr:MAG: hypothetical protein IPL87_03235 [Candidatus Moranbacteria bacterium]